MKPNSNRLLILILIAQTACVAVGLGFHHLYISAALLHAEEGEASAELARQFKVLAHGVDQAELSSLLRDPHLWENLVAQWRTNAAPDDCLYLVDSEGNSVAAVDGRSSNSNAPSLVGPLKLMRANGEWGRFSEPIRGLTKGGDGALSVAVGHGLGSQDGYVMLTRAISDEKLSGTVVRSALWAASGVTLMFTTVLQAATLFMIVTYVKQRGSRNQARPELDALKQAQALVRTQETVIFGLAKLSDSRDADTGSHLERIAHYSSILAAALRRRPEFREEVTPAFVQLIGISSALHDIGKVGVEDSILRKAGSLTTDERARMQCHTQIGTECLKEIERRLGSSNFLQMAREISSAHHEWWNGQGYPLGLAEEQIPLSARIVALADVYDALSCKRAYKEALPHSQCVAMIAEAAGTQFDARVVEVFLEIEDQFCRVAEQFRADAEPPNIAELSAMIPMAAPQDAEHTVTDTEFATDRAEQLIESELLHPTGL